MIRSQIPYLGAFKQPTPKSNVRDNQLKIIKYNHLIAYLMIFHNCHTIRSALKALERLKASQLTPELVAPFSPYRRHPNRFGSMSYGSGIGYRMIAMM